jgi:hypothetical protein
MTQLREAEKTTGVGTQHLRKTYLRYVYKLLLWEPAVPAYPQRELLVVVYLWTGSQDRWHSTSVLIVSANPGKLGRKPGAGAQCV